MGSSQALFVSLGLSKMVFIIWDHHSALPLHLGCCHTGFIWVSVHLGCTWEGVLHRGVEGSWPTSHWGWGHGHLPKTISISSLSSSPPALPWRQHLNICHSRFMLWGKSCPPFYVTLLNFESIRKGLSPWKLISLLPWFPLQKIFREARGARREHEEEKKGG